MSEPDEQDIIQWQDALRWLDRASGDLRAVRVLLRDGIAMQGAFHLQQAVEKTLKALLVAARQDVRKTHDIDTLADLVRRHWPDLVAAPFTLSYLSRWYIVSRYPGDDDVGPTVLEVQEALPEVESLFSAATMSAPTALAAEVDTIRQGRR
jgi:HEPN domain-containing protein